MQKTQETMSLVSRIPHAVAAGTGDQRAEDRAISGEKLFIQVTQAEETQLVGKTISCIAVDASAHGIKLITEEFIPVGCLLDLWVDDLSRPGKYFLSGDIRWTQKVNASNTMIGVRLQDGVATDIDQWRDTYPD
jgi:hypothetical protein